MKKKHFNFSEQCLSENRALVLFIGQISCEAEVFWVEVCLRAKKNLFTVSNLIRGKKIKSAKFFGRFATCFWCAFCESSRADVFREFRRQLRKRKCPEELRPEKRCVTKNFISRPNNERSSRKRFFFRTYGKIFSWKAETSKHTQSAFWKISSAWLWDYRRERERKKYEFAILMCVGRLKRNRAWNKKKIDEPKFNQMDNLSQNQ